MSVSLLPKDVIRLLMIHYFDPQTALQCLRVSKVFYQSVTPDEIAIRLVRKTVQQKHSLLERIISCELCNCLLNRKNLMFHLEKHKRNRGNFRVHPAFKPRCEKCHLKFPSQKHANDCPLKMVSCHDVFYCPSFDVIRTCDSVKDWRIRILSSHKCTYQCLKCEKILSEDEVWDHTRAHRSESINWTWLLAGPLVAFGLGYLSWASS